MYKTINMGQLSHDFIPTHLEIAVNYTKSGMSGFDWTYKKGGYRLSLTPKEKTKHGFKSILMGEQWGSGFYLPILETEARKNPHYIKRLEDAVNDKADAIAQAYEQKDIEKLRAIVEELKVIK